MYTSQNEFPIWIAGIIINKNMQPDPSMFEYKYIIVSNSNSQHQDFVPKPIGAYWETFENNRAVCLMQIGEVQIQDVFNIE